ncbi:MAG: pyridoxal-phosphate dependent enzyme, partial [Pseudomonadota bacterium]
MSDANPSNPDIDLAAIQAAGTRLAAHIRRTPCQPSRTLSAQLGLELALKFENLQFTASFKERGALNSLLQMGDAARQGVIAMSAGNHAQ